MTSLTRVLLDCINKLAYGREETHILKVLGSNPGTKYWMDMTLFHIDLLKKLYCLFEKTENKRKEARVGPVYFILKIAYN